MKVPPPAQPPAQPPAKLLGKAKHPRKLVRYISNTLPHNHVLLLLIFNLILCISTANMCFWISDKGSQNALNCLNACKDSGNLTRECAVKCSNDEGKIPAIYFWYILYVNC